MTATTAKQTKSSTTTEPTLKDMEDYLRSAFPVENKQVLIVRHLWDNNFRLNLYEIEKENNVLKTMKMVSSKFLRIVIIKNKMTHKICE